MQCRVNVGHSFDYLDRQLSATILPSARVRLRVVRPRVWSATARRRTWFTFPITYQGLATPSTSSVAGNFADFPTHDFSEFCGLTQATFFARRLAGRPTNASHSSSVENPASHAA